jgi:hypothetical protein
LPALLAFTCESVVTAPPSVPPLAAKSTVKVELALKTIHSTATIPEVSPRESNLNEADCAAIRLVIQDQLQAFKAGDAARAFYYASPGIKRTYRSPTAFVAMIKQSYPLVFKPKAVIFEAPHNVLGIVTQTVILLTGEGQLVVASYLMEKEGTGDWKINGCVLAPAE